MEEKLLIGFCEKSITPDRPVSLAGQFHTRISEYVETPPPGPYKVDMWQYSATGTVPGINGKVDLNLYFPYE